MARYDVLVVGLGIMGSAISYELARRGMKVLAIDTFWPLHDRGASTGESRILRRTHPKYPFYATDTEPALRCWQSLEKNCGKKLFHPTGGLLIGGAGGPVVPAAVAAAKIAGSPYLQFGTAELRRRYSEFDFSDTDEGFLDVEAGILLAESCLTAYQRAAVVAGAELRFGVQFDLSQLTMSWLEHLTVILAGERVTASRVVLSVGAWLAIAPPALRWPEVLVERTVTHWFSAGPHAESINLKRTPFVEWRGDDESELCMIPTIAGRIKVKTHHSGEHVDLSEGPRSPTYEETMSLQSRFESLSGLHLQRPLQSTASMYTNTNDESLRIASHPSIDNIIVVAACSGHGFKFAPLVAVKAAQLCGA